jgi:quercetin dioxygenase-like cupin family protein
MIMADQLLPDEKSSDTYIKPGEAGHNAKEVVWERWQKKRTFVRALEGTYGDVYKDLFTQPRVINSHDCTWKGGPQLFDKSVINPASVAIAQSIECHINAFSPNGAGIKHGHMNSAVFFVLKGRGHDIHDRTELHYQAGDACVVENSCVHEHLSDGEEMLVLVMKAKPLFLFMHMIFQKNVAYPPKTPSLGGDDYMPPNDY